MRAGGPAQCSRGRTGLRVAALRHREEAARRVRPALGCRLRQVFGMAKDQINRGGEKVAPEEVENVVLAHPAVHDVSVVAVPDAYLGERTCAYVVLRAGADPVKPVAIKKFVRERGLAAYKVPDRVELVDALPRTGIGKVSKKDLRTAAVDHRGS